MRDNEQGVGIEIDPKFVKVYHNMITNNSEGLTLNYKVASCSVYENIISHNNVGIYLETLFDNIVEFNQIQDNSLGISAYNSKGTIQHNNFVNNTKHAYVSKGVILLGFLLNLRYNQHWTNNYWDDWTTDSARPIKGNVNLYVIIWLIHFPNPLPIPQQIGTLPSYQFDWHPAPEPYNIPGME